VSLFCCVIPKHTDASLLYLHWFKYYIMTKIRPWNSQRFTKSHFHSAIILQSVTCQVPLQWSELHYRFPCLRSEIIHMSHHLSTAYFHYDRIFKLLTRWGECVNVDGEYDEKDDTLVEKVNYIGSCDDFSLVLRNTDALFIAHSLWVSKSTAVFKKL